MAKIKYPSSKSNVLLICVIASMILCEVLKTSISAARSSLRRGRQGEQKVDVAMAETFYFRLTGMVKAKVMRLDKDLGVLVETEEERDVYFGDVENVRGLATKTDAQELFRVTEQEC